MMWRTVVVSLGAAVVYQVFAYREIHILETLIITRKGECYGNTE